MKYPNVEVVLADDKAEAGKGDAAEFITVEIKFLCPKGFKPHDVALVQSPGPIPYLGDYHQNAIFDPMVEEMKVTKREKVPADVLNRILHGDEDVPEGEV